ncbi:MAG: VWA domain-containing protein [Ruminococcus sp.]|nr:VWA domain-containing protein [Ruminococcus sp.]
MDTTNTKKAFSLKDHYNSKWFNNEEVKDYLRSRSFKNYIIMVAFGIAGKYVPIVFLEGGNELGWTDNKKTYINIFPEMLKECTVEELVCAIHALVVHEHLHTLYTDFKTLQEMDTELLQKVHNIVEDGRIERIGGFRLPGWSPCLYMLNKTVYNIQQEYFKKKSKPMTPFQQLYNALWDYAKVGITPDKFKDEKMQKAWKEIRLLVLKARYSDQAVPAFECCKEIVKILSKFKVSPVTDIEVIRRFRSACQGQDAKTGEQIPQNLMQDTPDNSSGNGGEGGRSSEADSEQEDSESLDNEPYSDEDEKEFLEKLHNDLDNVYGEYEAEKETEKNDNEIIKPLKEECKDLSTVTTENEQTYNFIKDKYSGVIQNMKTKLFKTIHFNMDEKIRKLSRGKVDSKSLTNVINGRICAARKDKSDETNLNITFLLDKSGSMKGARRDNTLYAAIIMQEALETLKIPTTFLTFGSKADILKHWKQSRIRKYGILNYSISGSTALHKALIIANTYILSKQAAYDKIMFVITDGTPDSTSFAKTQISISERMGCQVFGIGIGPLNPMRFVELFGKDKFILVPKLEDLPLELTSVVRKNLLRRG